MPALFYLSTLLLVVLFSSSTTCQLFNFAKTCELSSLCSQMASTTLYSCDFEVFGIVQGVFFRKYTEKQAKSLGIRGWCMNTRDGTVKGQMEGQLNQINEMKNWLKTKGSPTSRIDKTVFGELKEIKDYTFSDFSVKR